MELSDDATDEIAALSAILGPDCWLNEETNGHLVLCVSPEVDSSEEVGCLALEVTMPPNYPATSKTTIVCSSLAHFAHYFEHRVVPAGGFFTPTPEQAAGLEELIMAAIGNRPGEAVVYDAVDAVRQWLEANTLGAKPTLEVDAAVRAMMADAEVSEDDLELDDEDIDEELIDAMKEVLEDDKEQLKRLREAERLPSGSASQREAIIVVWRSMSKQQRRTLVEDSDDEDFHDDDDDDDDDYDFEPETRAPKASHGGGGGGSSRQMQPKKAAPLPPRTQRVCPRGHSLTPVNGQPADYRKLGEGVGTCDVCGADFEYTRGGYHCEGCRNWDCCVSCGSSSAKRPGGAGGTGQGKSNKNGKQRR